jgi:hypothetical protein
MASYITQCSTNGARCRKAALREDENAKGTAWRVSHWLTWYGNNVDSSTHRGQVFTVKPTPTPVTCWMDKGTVPPLPNTSKPWSLGPMAAALVHAPDLIFVLSLRPRGFSDKPMLTFVGAPMPQSSLRQAGHPWPLQPHGFSLNETENKF